MSMYQTFFDGMALGFFLGFLAFYLFYRFKVYRSQNPKDDIDVLVEDFRLYYQHVSEKKRRNFE